jgi:hypothetical protein
MEFFGAPVDIVEPELSDFACSQSISCKQHQDGVIAQPDRRLVPPGYLQHLLHLFFGKRPRDIFKLIEHRPGDEWGQICRDDSVCVQILQEAPQTGGHTAACGAAQFAHSPVEISVDLDNAHSVKRTAVRFVSQPL